MVAFILSVIGLAFSIVALFMVIISRILFSETSRFYEEAKVKDPKKDVEKILEKYEENLNFR